jgi:hypothetical protein
MLCIIETQLNCYHNLHFAVHLPQRPDYCTYVISFPVGSVTPFSAINMKKKTDLAGQQDEQYPVTGGFMFGERKRQSYLCNRP